MPFFSLIPLCFAAIVTSQGCDISGALGGGSGPASDAASQQVIIADNQHPNATSEVRFNVSSSTQDSAVGFEETWTWRVNISDIPISSLNRTPGYINSAAGDLNGSHFVNTVYSLEWPEGGTLSNLLANLTTNTTDSQGQLCVSIFDLGGLPHNVSNNYREEDGGACSSVFGERCVQAILAQMTSGISNCGVPPFPTEIPECNSTLGLASCYGSFTYQLGNTTYSNFTQGNETSLRRSGDPFYFFATGVSPAGNNSRFENAGQQLQAIMLSGVTNQLLCQKVNKTEAATSSAVNVGAFAPMIMGVASVVAIFVLI